MKTLSGRILIWVLAVSVAIAGRVSAQDVAPSAPFKLEEIEQLVAPIALYPDALVAQVLMASTYPLEVVHAARWSKSNSKVTGKALEDAMQAQPWDPAVKSLTAFPQVLAMLNEKIDMTQRLGDAFLGQQKDVLDAIQRLRARAQAAGNLKSGKEQTVTTAQEGGSTVIKIEPTDPQVVYVPTYDPSWVYGTWPYPAYPPYYYYPAGYYPGYYYGAGLFAFTAGVIIGSALWGGCNWGGGRVYVDHRNYNNFNRTNIKDGNWQHNPANRKGVQYRDQASQKRFGGEQRQGAQAREQFRGRAEQGQRDIARGGDQFRRDVSTADRARAGDRAGDRVGSGGLGDRGGALSDRAGAGNRGGSDFQRAGSGRSAFDGAGRGGGGQTRDFSSRGVSSREAVGGGGVSRSGGGGGRAGGGGRGGGRR